MLDAWIGLGTNLGDRLAELRRAVEALARIGRVRARSPVYETPAATPKELLERAAEAMPEAITGARTDATAKPFLSAALWLETSLSPQELAQRLHEVEAQAQPPRADEPVSAPRPLTLDLLLLGQKGDLVLVSPSLTVPHPRLHLRAFALRPLLDLAPALIHPALSLPLRVLYRLLPAELSSLRLKGWL